jgi:hypothetical protein
MSNYTKSTNFATKDNLSPGDPLKIVRGTEIDTEFNNISTAISTKTDNSAAAITGGSITGITDLAIADGGTGASTATAAINNLLPAQTSAANKYLQSDGTNVSWDAVTLSTSDITGTLAVANGGTGITSFGTGIATFLGTPSSANLASAVTDETGSGSLVFANTPTLVAPILGTPTSGNFSSGSFTWPTFNQNTTGTAAGLSATLAIASGGTGQTTANAAFNALAPSQTSASGKYLKSDGTNTSWDALDISTADITGTLPVANGGTGVTSSTGTGSVVLSNSPTLVTPILGTPQSGNFSTGTFTWPTFNQNTTGTAAGLSATLATTSGGTGLTSFTSGGVVYASSTSALATGSALVFDGSNLGLGVTPSAWGGGTKALQFSSGYVMSVGSGALFYMGANNYYDGSNYRYVNTAAATQYSQTNGAHNWLTAASGTAGTNISYTQAMTLDASGNLGVGTTTTTGYILRVNAASPLIGMMVSGTQAFTIGALSGGGGAFYYGAGNAEAARIDSSGNLLVGTTASGYGKLTVVNPTGVSAFFSNSTYLDQYLKFTEGTGYTIEANYGLNFNVNTLNAAYPMKFSMGGTERARIDSSGNFLVGTTDASVGTGAGFKVLGGRPVVTNAQSTDGGATVYEAYSTGAGAYRFYVGMGGTVFATSIVISAISDQRLKENVRDIETGLDAIMALKPRRFDWKEGKGQDKKNVAGFIAQEFETVFPECVGVSRAGEDGIEYKNINHETLIPTLVKAMQELKAEFDAYKASHP